MMLIKNELDKLSEQPDVNYREHPNPTVPKKPSLWKRSKPIRMPLLRLFKVIFFLPFFLIWFFFLGWVIMGVSYILTGWTGTWYPGSGDPIYWFEPFDLWWKIGEGKEE